MKTRKETSGKDREDTLFAYFKAFVDDKGVASVTPSSKFLVNRVLKAMDLRASCVVVEYGAAEGVMTRKILDGLPKTSSLIAFELNEKLFAGLGKIEDPRLTTLHGDVRNVDKTLKAMGIGEVDVIVSGIPFAFLGSRGRHELLTKTCDLLKPGGRFVAYQVTTHLIPLLKDYFKRVDTQFEIRNLPPHFVFTAFK
jgi:phospholipid N-methyltransferase